MWGFQLRYNIWGVRLMSLLFSHSEALGGAITYFISFIIQCQEGPMLFGAFAIYTAMGFGLLRWRTTEAGPIWSDVHTSSRPSGLSAVAKSPIRAAAPTVAPAETLLWRLQREAANKK